MLNFESKNIMSRFQNDSIFWIDVDKIRPNPYQPRKVFDEVKLQGLADSVRQYGILQPLIVTRIEIPREDGGLDVIYELIAGERRHRASRMAGLSQVPVLVRSGEESEQLKLELAIIENLQREDLNPIERARAFGKLASDFSFKHSEIGKKLGKSREYVSNTIRLLTLPDYIQEAVEAGKISEGHARPMLMLKDKPEERDTLFKEVIYKKITVREAEKIARKIAYDKIRKKELVPDLEIMKIEETLSQSFGTRVQIERKNAGGKIVIDFFSPEDLQTIINVIGAKETINDKNELLDRYVNKMNGPTEGNQEKEDLLADVEQTGGMDLDSALNPEIKKSPPEADQPQAETNPENKDPLVDIEQTEDVDLDSALNPENQNEDSDDLYSIKNFSI